MSFKAYVESEPWNGTKKLYLIETRGDHSRAALSIGRDGILMGEPIKENQAISPTPLLVLIDHYADEIFPAIIEALSKKGFERPSESTLRGENGAMKAHLQDLRKLLKLGVVLILACGLSGCGKDNWPIGPTEVERKASIERSLKWDDLAFESEKKARENCHRRGKSVIVSAWDGRIKDCR